MSAEEVVINIVANDEAGSVLEGIISKLGALQSVSASVQSALSNVNNISSNIKDVYNVSDIKNASQQFQNLFSKITAPPSLDTTIKQLEQLRNNAKNVINIRINDGSVKGMTEKTAQLDRQLNTIRSDAQSSISAVKALSGTIIENSRQSFAGNWSGFQLVGMPYDPTKLLGSAPSNMGELVKSSNQLNQNFANMGPHANNVGKQISNASKSSYSSFHQLNNMLLVVGNSINNIGVKIAGVFGATGMSGMIEKMWQGAAQRQQNMMYLMHQKGAEEANKYYDEIMDIVTQLPGDDTFLTNILNMASALDSSLKLDNLKEAGTAITDYYMAATMKGENSYETQKDIRKYVTTGDTRGLRNSVLASEIDLLKDKNSVLERTQALEKALEKTGFSGMSEYESALNQWEEFKGHFQKAFADLGGLVLAVTQPLMKFYNTLDTVFGSRVSQMIIVFATVLIGLFTVVGGGLIILSSGFRIFETISLGMEALGFALGSLNSQQGIFNTLLIMSMSLEEREKYLKGELTLATWSETSASIKNTIARTLGITVGEGEVLTNRKLVSATLILIGSKIKEIMVRTKSTLSIILSIAIRIKNGEITLSEAVAKEVNTLAESNNTIATILNTGSTIANAIGHGISTVAKIGETVATYGLVASLEALWTALGPIGWIILAISVAIMGLIALIKIIAPALGWFKDIGSMFEAIGDGINRMWNAFMNSDIIQGIISYFQKFVASIQYVFESITNLINALFGLGGDGTFDIVQSIINLFGKLGEIIMWVWNLLDDFSNSPLGFVTWLNPLGIILFHLDEIGSFFEDVGDAINRFIDTPEFQELADSFAEIWTELQEPFQEIWNLLEEIGQIFGEIFQDPEGQGTEDRINFLVEVLKGLAFVIKTVVVPAIRAFVLIIRVVLMPIKAILEVIKAIGGAINWVTTILGSFTVAWEVLTNPIKVVYSIIEDMGKMINQVSDAIKNSIIGKLLGWDKDDNDKEKQVQGAKNNLYDKMKTHVEGSNMDFVTKHKILGELDKQNMNSDNVNNVRNLGSTYNNANNQKSVVINQNFAQGSMPIDARNMTKKEARKMFIGAFGYRRAVGSNGILK